MDALLLLRASTMGAQKARSMKSGVGAFDIDEFVSKLITFMGGRKQMDQNLDDSDVEGDTDGDAPLDWEKIGRKALAKSRRVPVMDFM
jgi:non-structural maintenance of chromosomes element 4